MAANGSVTSFLFMVVLGSLGIYILLKLVGFARTVSDHLKSVEAKRNEKRKKDDFEKKNRYSWDYVMVIEVFDRDAKLTNYQKQYSLANLVNKIHKAGLDYGLFFSLDYKRVFLKIRGSKERLLVEADRIDYQLELDDVEIEKTVKRGKMIENKWIWKPFEIPNPRTDPTVKQQCPYEPYGYHFYKYDVNEDFQRLYKRYSHEKSILRSTDRIKLIYSILSAPERCQGCALSPNELQVKKAIIAQYPLHDYGRLHRVSKTLLNFCLLPWKHNIEEVKDYFGEKIGFYFEFLGEYTTNLIFPSFIGFCCWIDQAANGVNSNATVVMAIFVSLWSTVFIENWKRKQAGKAMKWGMTNYREEEQYRPQFEGVKSIDPVSGKETLYFPMSKFFRRAAFSQTIIAVFIAFVASIVMSIFIFKSFLMKSPQDENVALFGAPMGSNIASFLTALQIQISSYIYQRLALYLNDYENHRTESEYEDALVVKTFLFQFVNSYAPLIYIAFIKEHFDGCIDGEENGCINELSNALGYIYVTRLVVDNFFEVVLPFVKLVEENHKMRANRDSNKINPSEEQFVMEHYDVMLGPFGDYCELAIQFGYISLFVSSFPLAFPMSLLSNYIEIRADGWKLCQNVRRPEPRGAEDIGSWLIILEIFSVLATIFNGAIIFFTSKIYSDQSYGERLIHFIIFEHMILALKAILAYAIPDIPQKTIVQLKRREHLINKLFRNEPDDDDDLDVEVKGTNADLTIFNPVNAYQ